MIYTPLTKKAMRICFEKHKNQMDKCGVPYAFHPLHVAESMVDEETTIAALLHDVVEDTDTTFEELEEYGFPSEVIEALKLLTHDNDVPYLEYVKNTKQNRIARAVKIADAINSIEGAPVSTYAKELSEKWAQGIISDSQMIELLVNAHKKVQKV